MSARGRVTYTPVPDAGHRRGADARRRTRLKWTERGVIVGCVVVGVMIGATLPGWVWLACQLIVHIARMLGADA